MSEEVPIVGNEVKSSKEPLRIRTWQETVQQEQHKKPIQERVDALTYVRPFPIKEVDLLTVKRFILFCRFNSKNDWGVGLKMLLDYVDHDAKTVMLYDKILQLENSLEELKLKVETNNEVKKDKKPKTFGRGEKK